MKWPWSKSEPEVGAIINTLPWDLSTEFGLGFPIFSQSIVGNREVMDQNFLAFVQRAYKSSPVIFTCIMNRMLFFSEARFLYREMNDGRPGDYFSNEEMLKPLRNPWPNGNTGDLLSLAEVHVSCAGNFFVARRGDFLKPMRPDWVTIVLGSMQDPSVEYFDLDAEVIGYIYNPGGMSAEEDWDYLGPDEVAHYMPYPDPEAPFRGMSWITPVIQEALADKEMTQHKRKFLEAGATPNLAVKLSVDKVEEFDAWVQKFREASEGVTGNPYRTLFLASAADPIPIGANMEQLDFSNVQGAGEVRIAAAAKVHPAYAGFSEGLKGSALSQGNMAEISRLFADTLMRPLWRNFANSMETIIDLPPAPQGADGVMLWYDDRDIPALQQDETAAAAVLQVQSATVASLIQAGFQPDDVIDAVNANDLSRLQGKHTGMTSVQLYPPGVGPAPAPPRNGNSPESAPTPN